ncbi:MAG TPA: DNA recombination protein RmuC [Saprospiraceae bacterium]|nr:DNA recombination protein RmuC [Saprospiraceae bacterium]HMQ85264.1 DNA recombination protein RmuC [Saprospiraceae bacterium]
MDEALLLPLLLTLLLGLLLGTLGGWLWARMKLFHGFVSKSELEQQYIAKGLYAQLQERSDVMAADLNEKEVEIRTLGNRLAAQEQSLLHLEDQLHNRQQLEEQSKNVFENLANRLLEEKGTKFSLQHQEQLGQLLLPLREKIKDFEEQIEKRFLEETKDRISLKKEIEHLRELNQQLSQDANNLAGALKGNSKTQGDWGEIQLELLLEKAGLVKGIHFVAQPTYTDADGQLKRPDFVIHLPQEKHLVIDSKVSLRDYDRFYEAQDDLSRQAHLKSHVESLRRHVKNLSSKNYQLLYQINSPDYLLLFVPIEPAFTLAVQHDQRLFLDALDQNIVLVSASTLLATMRTVAYLWKQEKQKNNVLEIARQSGMLYDKFCNFVTDLREVGTRLDQAQLAYGHAMNKLIDSRKYGDTLVGRAQKIRNLGAKASKKLPPDLLRAHLEEEE